MLPTQHQSHSSTQVGNTALSFFPFQRKATTPFFCPQENLPFPHGRTHTDDFTPSDLPPAGEQSGTDLKAPNHGTEDTRLFPAVPLRAAGTAPSPGNPGGHSGGRQRRTRAPLGRPGASRGSRDSPEEIPGALRQRRGGKRAGRRGHGGALPHRIPAGRGARTAGTGRSPPPQPGSAPRAAAPAAPAVHPAAVSAPRARPFLHLPGLAQPPLPPPAPAPPAPPVRAAAGRCRRAGSAGPEGSRALRGPPGLCGVRPSPATSRLCRGCVCRTLPAATASDLCAPAQHH